MLKKNEARAAEEPARRGKERERGYVCKEGAWRQLEKPEQRACARLKQAPGPDTGPLTRSIRPTEQTQLKSCQTGGLRHSDFQVRVVHPANASAHRLWKQYVSLLSAAQAPPEPSPLSELAVTDPDPGPHLSSWPRPGPEAGPSTTVLARWQQSCLG
jgi:hypothetical protein